MNTRRRAIRDNDDEVLPMTRPRTRARARVETAEPIQVIRNTDISNIYNGTTLVLGGREFNTARDNLVVLYGDMYNTNAADFRRDLKNIASVVGYLPENEANNLRMLTTWLQNEHLQMIREERENEYTLTELRTNLQIVGAEQQTALARQGIEMYKGRNNIIKEVLITVPALLIATVGSRAISNLKGDIALSMAGYASYLNTGCTTQKVVQAAGYFTAAVTETVPLDDWKCNYLYPVLNVGGGLSTLASISSKVTDSLGAFSVYLVFLILFVLFSFILRIKRVGLTGIEFRFKSKRSKSKRPKSKRKSRKRN